MTKHEKHLVLLALSFQPKPNRENCERELWHSMAEARYEKLLVSQAIRASGLRQRAEDPDGIR